MSSRKVALTTHHHQSRLIAGDYRLSIDDALGSIVLRQAFPGVASIVLRQLVESVGVDRRVGFTTKQDHGVVALSGSHTTTKR